MKRCHGAALVALLVATAASPARAGAYGTELPFVIGTGARASSLGLAGSSLTRGTSLQYFNPAILGRQDYRSLEAFRTTLFDSDSQYHAFSYAHPTLDYGTIGVSVLRLDVGGVEQRDDLNNLVGEIKDAQTRILFGYGAAFNRVFAAGLNLKIDNHSFGPWSGTGVGLDAGVHARHQLAGDAIFREVRGGLTLQNLLEPSVKLDAEDVADPLQFLLGGSLVSAYGDFGFVTALDLVSPRFSPTLVRFGQEVSYAEMLALRVGVDGSNLTFGLGAGYRGVSLDYAFRDEDLGSNHRISLSIQFGPSVSEREAERSARMDAEMHARVTEQIGAFERDQLTRLVQRADSLFMAGDFAGAQGQYELVLVWDPSHEHAALRLTQTTYRVELSQGQHLLEAGDLVAALYRLRNASELNPSDPIAHEMISECQRRIDAADDRARLVDNLLRISIDRYAEGRYEEALSGFREVLRITPDNRVAREYAYKAETNIENAVQRLILRSRAQADRHEYGAAIASLEEAIAMSSDGAAFNAELEQLHERRRKWAASERDRARTDPQRTTRSATSRVTLPAEVLDAKFEKGMRDFEAGQFDAAAQAFLEVWTVSPTHRNVIDPLTRAYLFLGMQIYSAQRYDDAIRIWEKILAIDPNNNKAQRYLEKTREEASKLTGVKR